MTPAEDAKGLVLFCLFRAKKTKATAEAGAARPGAYKNFLFSTVSQ